MPGTNTEDECSNSVKQTACDNVLKRTMTWWKKFNSQEFLKLEESLHWNDLQYFFMIGMMVLVVGPSACKEYPLLREDPKSRIYALIQGQTTNGPVLQVLLTRCLDVSEFEIQIHSTTGDDSKSWVVTSRGNNHDVDESRLNDPDYNPRCSELVHQIGMERLVEMTREPSPAKMEISWNTEEIRASQPKVQSTPVNDHSEESIPIEEKKWNDILAKRNITQEIHSNPPPRNWS